MKIRGTCFCHAITYEIDGPLRDAASCHCSMCRKMFGSQASVYALFDPQKFSWQTGQELLSTYKADKEHGIQFCSQCGSTLGGTFNDEVCWISLGCVEGDPEITLGKHIFVGSKAAWETIPTDVIQYDSWPPEG